MENKISDILGCTCFGSRLGAPQEDVKPSDLTNMDIGFEDRSYSEGNLPEQTQGFSLLNKLVLLVVRNVELLNSEKLDKTFSPKESVVTCSQLVLRNLQNGVSYAKIGMSESLTGANFSNLKIGYGILLEHVQRRRSLKIDDSAKQFLSSRKMNFLYFQERIELEIIENKISIEMCYLTTSVFQCLSGFLPSSVYIHRF